ncbi:TonB-dependent receptor [Sphingobium sp.]|uniref:TonB-dependent receptor n=1 Tax=Sphingobium sp. TaxID=1912891 RepID=UPI0028BD75D2|nr:TonB-dependent receptor [Sphingobium sp.]
MRDIGKFIQTKNAVKISAMLLASGSSVPLLAQTASNNAQVGKHSGSVDSDKGIQEIVVTAQKRAESANSVPISITALSGDALVKQGISQPSDLVKIVPGFNFTTSNYGTPVFTLRGIGFYDVSLGSSPTVSVYVDEVPLAFSAMTRGAFLDVERVEVLKGPQGTLFGQNSTGGAINYIAAKPTSSFRSGGDVTFGRFNRLDAQAFVSGPLSDTISARLAVRTEQGGDWQKSQTRDAGLGQVDRLFGRLMLDIHPNDRFRVSLRADAWQDHSDSQASQLIFVNGNPARTPAVVRNSPLAPADDRSADWDPGADFQHDDKFFQGSARAEYDLTDDIKLTNISAYSHFKSYSPTDADGTQYQNFLGVQHGAIDSYYNEARVSGDMVKLKWVLGGSYQHDKVDDYLNGYHSQSSLPFPTSVALNFQKATTWAAFANADYEILSGLTVQGGIRYTSQKRAFRGCFADTGDGTFAAVQSTVASAANGRPIVIAPGSCVTLDANSLPVTVTNQLDQDNISWRAGFSWQPRSRLLLYANVSRGYKAGNFPTLGASRSFSYTPVTQESLLAYEAGFKATLADRTLQINGAAFYYDYSDKQIRGRLLDTILGVTGNALVNIPKSRVQGFEAQVTWVPVSNLQINTGVTHIDSRIKGPFFNYTNFAQLLDFGGESYPLTPKWQMTGDAEYSVPIADGKRFFLGASGTHQSRTNAAFGELPILAIKAYTLVDLRAGIGGDDNKWRVTAWVKNVGNTYYWNNTTTGIDTTYRFTGMPRTFGLSVSLRN